MQPPAQPVLTMPAAGVTHEATSDATHDAATGIRDERNGSSAWAGDTTGDLTLTAWAGVPTGSAAPDADTPASVDPEATQAAGRTRPHDRETPGPATADGQGAGQGAGNTFTGPPGSADVPVISPIQSHARPAPAETASPVGQASADVAPNGASGDAVSVPVAILQAPVAPDASAGTAAHRTSPEQIVAQVAPAVATLAKAPDGGASVTVQLHPAELGPVQIRIEKAAGGTTEVIVSAAKTGTLDALRNSEAELHHVLDQAGIASGGRTISFHQATPEATQPAATPTHSVSVASSGGRSSGGGTTADGSAQGRGGDGAGRGSSGWGGGSGQSGRQRAAVPQATAGRVYLGALDITA